MDNENIIPVFMLLKGGFDKKKPLEMGDLVVINNIEEGDKSKPTKPIFAYVETKCTATFLSPSNKLSPLLTG